jgi:hypothetical protein
MAAALADQSHVAKAAGGPQARDGATAEYTPTALPGAVEASPQATPRPLAAGIG